MRTAQNAKTPKKATAKNRGKERNYSKYQDEKGKINIPTENRKNKKGERGK